jgi:hypothetical protein
MCLESTGIDHYGHDQNLCIVYWRNDIYLNSQTVNELDQYIIVFVQPPEIEGADLLLEAMVVTVKH